MESRSASSGSVRSAEGAPAQYLTFELGAESYGLEILKIQEIVARLAITSVPRTPKCLKGVVNLRGKIIPILALRALFEMDEEDHDAGSCIIVTQIDFDGDLVTVGLLVDEASEVVKVPLAAIEKPSFLAGSRSLEFIDGIARLESRIVFLLNLERLFSAAERTAVRASLDLKAEPGEPDDDSPPAPGGTSDAADESVASDVVRDV